MITHKNKLQYQINKLQSLINDISETELEDKLSIGGGVIVDLICNSINTNTIDTKNLLINGVDIYESFSDKVLNAANITNLKTNEINNTGKIKTNTLETVTSTVTNSSCIKKIVCNYFKLATYEIEPIRCNIEIRDYPNPSKLLYNVYGIGLLYDKKIKFMYCSFITSSSCTGYTKPCVMVSNTNTEYNLYIRVIYIFNNSYNNSSTTTAYYTKLKYITGVVYDESYSSMIYQYDSSTRSGYNPYLLRENNDKGVFNRAGVCVEFKYAEIA